MTKDEIQHMWKMASNDPHHDTNWHDPVVIAFAKLIERRILSMDNPHLRIALDAAQDKARKDEREACAEACEQETYIDGKGTARAFARIIRARGEQA